MLKWSWKIAQVAGIGIYLHWTFLLLVGGLFLWMAQEAGVQNAAVWVAFVLALFGCVVLHELGHALTARHFGIRTRDITLLPIGGIARLERIPEDPKQELLIALAGPAVNVVIAGILFVVISLTSEMANLASPETLVEKGASFLQRLMALNILLVLFNLLPAFPMDGGRVLRALLARRMDYVQATGVAGTMGQGMAILFAAFAFFTGHLMLLFIALFVFLGAQAEARSVEVRWLIRGIPVHDAMITEFQVLKEDDTLDAAAEELIAGSQHDFPVESDGKLVGILPRQDLLKAIAERGREERVSEVMRREFRTVEETAMLEDIFEQISAGECPMIPVMQQGKLVGLATLENIGEWMMVQSALRDRR